MTHLVIFYISNQTCGNAVTVWLDFVELLCRHHETFIVISCWQLSVDEVGAANKIEQSRDEELSKIRQFEIEGFFITSKTYICLLAKVVSISH